MSSHLFIMGRILWGAGLTALDHHVVAIPRFPYEEAAQLASLCLSGGPSVLKFRNSTLESHMAGMFPVLAYNRDDHSLSNTVCILKANSILQFCPCAVS